MGDYLQPVDLHFTIPANCPDVPTFSPTFYPTFGPTFGPNLFPSQSLKPIVYPSIRSISHSPTQPPTFGVHFLGGDQNEGGDSDEIYEMVVDSDCWKGLRF